jgi:DNA-directed RNA polymerase subunit RPC12/RpoP
MSPETIIGIVVAGVVALSLIGKLLPKRQPKETHFKCSRCGANSRHTERTIEAWRNNKTKFFCQSCHAKWLQSRPPQERERFSSAGGSRSGCLGVVVLFALVPLAGYLLVQAYASV